MKWESTPKFYETSLTRCALSEGKSAYSTALCSCFKKRRRDTRYIQSEQTQFVFEQFVFEQIISMTYPTGCQFVYFAAFSRLSPKTLHNSFCSLLDVFVV
jgi:hypothetical protein